MIIVMSSKNTAQHNINEIVAIRRRRRRGENIIHSFVLNLLEYKLKTRCVIINNFLSRYSCAFYSGLYLNEMNGC